VSERRRIEGYDLARGLAIWGMVTVHFRLVMAFHARQPAWLQSTLELLDGRAAALFVILAGIGIALRRAGSGTDNAFQKSAETPAAAVAARNDRQLLFRRGVFLLFVGFLNLMIWKGDILRVYGISLFVASIMIRAPDRTLLVAAALFLLGFLLLIGVADYNSEWNWETFDYNNLWTIRGAVRNLFFNGFRSVFPWTGLFLFGIWIGRRLVSSQIHAGRLLGWSLSVALLTEVASALMVRFFRAHSGGLDDSGIVALFGTVSMPPLPPFLLAAGATSLAVIAASLMIAARYPDAFPVRAVVACGQMAFTWYVVHIVIGLGSLVALGLTDNQTLATAVWMAAFFFAGISLISLAIRAAGRRGPLEWLMRKVAG